MRQLKNPTAVRGFSYPGDPGYVDLDKTPEAPEGRAPVFTDD